MIDIYAAYIKNPNGSINTGMSLIQSIPAGSESNIRIENPTAKVEFGNAGSLDLTVMPDSIYYDAFIQMRTYILVKFDNDYIFYGRSLTPSDGFFGERKIHCEGALAFFNDSYYPGQNKNSRPKVSVLEHITDALKNHNDQLQDIYRTINLGELPGHYSNLVSEEQKIPNESQEFGSSSWTNTKSIFEDLKSHYGGAFRVRAEDYNDTIGRYGQGNIDLNNRIVVHNNDGSISTEISFSTNIDGYEVLLPTVINGQIVSEEEAINHYISTGEYLGRFSTVSEAESYAEALHNRQDWYYHGQPPVLYLDWMRHYFNSEVNTQSVEVGKNLIDCANSSEVSNIFTAIIPIGKSKTGDDPIYITGYRTDIHEGNYLTVPQICKSVNPNSFYTDEELDSGYHFANDYIDAVANYGLIFKTVELSDAHSAAELLTKAAEWIKNNYQGGVKSFTIKAVDLRFLGENVQKILVGDRVQLNYPIATGFHNGGTCTIAMRILTVLSASYDLYNPDNNQYTFGIPANMLGKTYGDNSAKKTKASSAKKPPEQEQPDPQNEYDTWLRAVFHWLEGHKVWYKSTRSVPSGPRSGYKDNYFWMPTINMQDGETIWQLWHPQVASIQGDTIIWSRDGQLRPLGQWISMKKSLFTGNVITNYRIIEYVKDEWGYDLRDGSTISVKMPTVVPDDAGGFSIFSQDNSGVSPEIKKILEYSKEGTPALNIFSRDGKNVGRFLGENGDYLFAEVDDQGHIVLDGNGNPILISLRQLKISTYNTERKVGYFVTEGPDGELSANTENTKLVGELSLGIEDYYQGQLVVARTSGDLVYLGTQDVVTEDGEQQIVTKNLTAASLNHMDMVCGDVSYETDPVTGIKYVVVNSGGGMRVNRGIIDPETGQFVVDDQGQMVRAEFGVYDNNNLTGGIMIDKINSDETSMKISATKLDIEGMEVDITAESLAEFGVWTDDNRTEKVGLVVQKLNEVDPETGLPVIATKINGDRVDITANQMASIGVWTDDNRTEKVGLVVQKLNEKDPSTGRPVIATKISGDMVNITATQMASIGVWTDANRTEKVGMVVEKLNEVDPNTGLPVIATKISGDRVDITATQMASIGVWTDDNRTEKVGLVVQKLNEVDPNTGLPVIATKINGDRVNITANQMASIGVWTDDNRTEKVGLVVQKLNEVDPNTGLPVIATKITGNVINIGSSGTERVLTTAINSIDNVVGEFDVVEDPSTHNKTVVVKSGGGLKVRRNNVEYGIYDNGNLSGGIIVDKINDGTTTTKIFGSRVILGENLTDDDLNSWAANARTGTGVFAKYLTVKKLTAQEITTLLANINTAEIGDITVDDITAKQIDAENLVIGAEDGGGGVTAPEVIALDAYFDALYIGADETLMQIADITKSADGKTLHIYKTDGTQIDFEKAASGVIGGAWSSGQGKYNFTVDGVTQNSIGFEGNPAVQLTLGHPEDPTLTVSGSVKNLNLKVTVNSWETTAGQTEVSTVRYTSNMVINVTSIYNNIYNTGWNNARSAVEYPDTAIGAYVDGSYASIDILVPKTNGSTQKDKYTYSLSKNLTFRPSGASSNIPVVELKKDSSTVVARIDCSSIYNNGEIAGETIGKNAVTLKTETWLYQPDDVDGNNYNTNTVSVTTNGRPTPLTKSVKLVLTQASSWQNNQKLVCMRTGTTTGPIYAKLYVNAPTPPAVEITGAWSNGTYQVKKNGANSISTILQALTPTGTVSKSGKSVARTYKVQYGPDENNLYDTGFTATASIDATGVYNDGWNASRGAVTVPSSAIGAVTTPVSIKIQIPKTNGSTQKDDTTYTMSKNSTFQPSGTSSKIHVVELKHNNGNVVARLDCESFYTDGSAAGYTNGYTNGKNDGIDEGGNKAWVTYSANVTVPDGTTPIELAYDTKYKFFARYSDHSGAAQDATGASLSVRYFKTKPDRYNNGWNDSRGAVTLPSSAIDAVTTPVSIKVQIPKTNGSTQKDDTTYTMSKNSTFQPSGTSSKIHVVELKHNNGNVVARIDCNSFYTDGIAVGKAAMGIKADTTNHKVVLYEGSGTEITITAGTSAITWDSTNKKFYNYGYAYAGSSSAINTSSKRESGVISIDTGNLSSGKRTITIKNGTNTLSGVSAEISDYSTGETNGKKAVWDGLSYTYGGGDSYSVQSGSGANKVIRMPFTLTISCSGMTNKVDNNYWQTTPTKIWKDAYKEGWDTSYATATLDSTAAKTLAFGESITVYARAKNYSGTVNNVAQRTIKAQSINAVYIVPNFSQRYANGYNATVYSSRNGTNLGGITASGSDGRNADTGIYIPLSENGANMNSDNLKEIPTDGVKENGNYKFRSGTAGIRYFSVAVPTTSHNLSVSTYSSGYYENSSESGAKSAASTAMGCAQSSLDIRKLRSSPTKWTWCKATCGDKKKYVLIGF